VYAQGEYFDEISTATYNVVNTITTGSCGESIGFSQNGGTMYASDIFCTPSYVYVVNRASNRVTNSYPGPVPSGSPGSDPYYYVTVVGGKGYALPYGAGTGYVVSFNPATGAVYNSLQLCSSFCSIELASPGGSYVYVMNYFDYVYFVRTADDTETASVYLGSGISLPNCGFLAWTQPQVAAISPDGSTIYVYLGYLGIETCPFTVVQNYVLSIVNVNTQTATTVPLGLTDGMSGMTVSANGKYLYMTDSNANLVRVIATKTDSFVANIPVIGDPYKIVT
jgi:YVTN family beta-propeller protein